MLLDENIRKEITPKRVYTVLKLVSKCKLKKDVIKELIQPEKLNGSQSEVTKVISYLMKIDFINKDADDFLILNIDKKHIESIDEFRKYFASRVFEGEDKNDFFRFTSWYLSKDSSILKYSKTADIVANEQEVGNLTNEFVLAWRFWVVFLGMGYMHSAQFIHNPYLRIKDAIEFNDDIEKEKRLNLKKFVEWCIGKCPELKESVNNNTLSYAFSFALRTLHDMGKIQLNLQQDSTEVWHLYKLETHDIREDVSEVIIKR